MRRRVDCDVCWSVAVEHVRCVCVCVSSNSKRPPERDPKKSSKELAKASISEKAKKKPKKILIQIFVAEFVCSLIRRISFVVIWLAIKATTNQSVYGCSVDIISHSSAIYRTSYTEVHCQCIGFYAFWAYFHIRATDPAKRNSSYSPELWAIRWAFSFYCW